MANGVHERNLIFDPAAAQRLWLVRIGCPSKQYVAYVQMDGERGPLERLFAKMDLDAMAKKASRKIHKMAKLLKENGGRNFLADPKEIKSRLNHLRAVKTFIRTVAAEFDV